MKHLLFLLFLTLPSALFAQMTAEEAVRRLYADCVDDAVDTLSLEALDAVLAIDSLQYEAFSDSLRYAYHYGLFGQAYYSHPMDTALMLEQLPACIELREKRVGILDMEYLYLLRIYAQLLDDQGQAADAVEMAQRALVSGERLLADSTQDEMRLLKAHLYGDLAVDYYHVYEATEVGRYCDISDYCFQQAFQGFKDDAELRIEDRVYPLTNGAYLWDNIKRYDLALPAYQRAYDYLQQEGITEGEIIERLLARYALCLHRNGQRDQARPIYEQALRLITDRAGAESDSLDMPRVNYIILLAEQGDVEAVEAQRKPLERKSLWRLFIDHLAALSYLHAGHREAYDEVNREIGKWSEQDRIDILAAVYNDRESNAVDEEALLRYMEDYLPLAERYSTTEAGYSMYVSTLSDLALAVSDTARATRYAAEAVAQYERDGIKDTATYGGLVGEYVNVYMWAGKMAETREVLERVLRCIAAQGDREVYAYFSLYLGYAQTEAGETTTGAAHLEEGRALLEELGGTQTWEYGVALRYIGRNLMQQGRREEAMRKLQEARMIEVAHTGGTNPETQRYIHELQQP